VDSKEGRFHHRADFIVDDGMTRKIICVLGAGEDSGVFIQPTNPHSHVLKVVTIAGQVLLLA
jgi:hypothetical protein